MIRPISPSNSYVMVARAEEENKDKDTQVSSQVTPKLFQDRAPPSGDYSLQRTLSSGSMDSNSSEESFSCARNCSQVAVAALLCLNNQFERVRQNFDPLYWLEGPKND